MKGSIRFDKRRNQYFAIVFSKDDKKYKWSKGFAKEGDAEAELRSLLKKYDDGLLRFTESDCFGDVCDEWLTEVAPEIYRAEGSVRNASGHIKKHFKPYIGEKTKIDSINARTLQKMFHQIKVSKWVKNEETGKMEEITVKASNSYKKKLFTTLNSIFISAIKWGYISENPCTKVDISTPEHDDPVVWNADQLNFFFNLKNVQQSKYYLAFIILGTTAMRRSECCGLQWSDFDGVGFVLNRGVDVYGNYTYMKTSSSRHRRTDLMSFVIDLINMHRMKQEDIKNKIPETTRFINHIITDEWNNPINPSVLTKNWSRLVLEAIETNKNYYLPYIPLKNLRHSFATAAITNNINIKIVQELLGHSRLSTTQNFYQGAANRSLHQGAVMQMEGLVFEGFKHEKPDVKEGV